MKKYKSCAKWPKGCFDSQNNYTEDSHYTHGEATGVCKLLRKNGAGGEGKFYPVKTWVEIKTQEI